MPGLKLGSRGGLNGKADIATYTHCQHVFTEHLLSAGYSSRYLRYLSEQLKQRSLTSSSLYSSRGSIINKLYACTAEEESPWWAGYIRCRGLMVRVPSVLKEKQGGQWLEQTK